MLHNIHNLRVTPFNSLLQNLPQRRNLPSLLLILFKIQTPYSRSYRLNISEKYWNLVNSWNNLFIFHFENEVSYFFL